MQLFAFISFMRLPARLSLCAMSRSYKIQQNKNQGHGLIFFPFQKLHFWLHGQGKKEGQNGHLFLQSVLNLSFFQSQLIPFFLSLLKRTYNKNVSKRPAISRLNKYFVLRILTRSKHKFVLICLFVNKNNNNMPNKRQLVTSKFPFITQQLFSWKHSYRKHARSYRQQHKRGNFRLFHAFVNQNLIVSSYQTELSLRQYLDAECENVS